MRIYGEQRSLLSYFRERIVGSSNHERAAVVRKHEAFYRNVRCSLSALGTATMLSALRLARR
jgi:hypothetical protein